ERPQLHRPGCFGPRRSHGIPDRKPRNRYPESPLRCRVYGVESNFSVSGARAEGQAYLLDSTNIQGFWNHGSGSGVMGTTLGIEAIAEFSVLTNTYSAQFGGNGAVVNAVTKSGTNHLHGSAYEFMRNSALDAREFFDSIKPPFRQNQFGARLGGPIKTDKLFFFVNDEELRRSNGKAVH